MPSSSAEDAMASFASPENGSCGYLTLARGAPMFLEMAVDLALSLREHDQRPVSIVVDESLRAGLESAGYAGVFDHVLPFPSVYASGRAAKFCVAELTPYSRTLFVDADVLALGAVEPLWAALRPCTFAMIGQRLDGSTDRKHHGFAIRALMREFELDAYFKNHSAIVYFEREAGREVMEECAGLYLSRLLTLRRRLNGFVGDEIAFGIVGARRSFSLIPDAVSVYWAHEVRHGLPDPPTKPFCHFIHAMPPAAFASLMDSARHRRRAAGIPGDPAPHWSAKLNQRGRARTGSLTLRRLRRLRELVRSAGAVVGRA